MQQLRTFSEAFAPLSDGERRRSLDAALATRPASDPDDGGLWLFGYASLMWDKDYAGLKAIPARLDGWHRAMCVWTTLARGSLALPGLSLGLRPGGLCDGLALWLAEADLAQIMPALWQREIWTDIYQAQWLPLKTADGEVTALAFTINPVSRQYARGLSTAEIAAHIARAEGERGPCLAYLTDTVAALEARDLVDADLEDLLEAVRAAGRQIAD